MKTSLLSLLALLIAVPVSAKQVSGPDMPHVRPPERPDHLMKRPSPFFSEMIRLFNASYDRETRALTARGAEQEAFCASGPVSTERPSAGPEAATVALLSLYEDGSFSQGTGTVILGSGRDGGGDRVLTAAHVLPPFKLHTDGSRSPLVQIIAFGADGGMIAHLVPVVSGDVALLNQRNDPNMLFDDVAVLEPVRFADAEAERAWPSRGVPLAPAQPERLLALFQPPNSVALNPGMSGAGLFDEAGSLIGVFGYTLYLAGEPYLARPKTGYEMAFLNRYLGEESAPWARGMAELILRSGRELRRDNVGYATPVRQSEIRAALGADPDPSAAPPEGPGTVLGYPFLSCLSVDVHYVGSVLPEAINQLRTVADYAPTPISGLPLGEIIIAKAAP